MFRSIQTTISKYIPSKEKLQQFKNKSLSATIPINSHFLVGTAEN